MKKNNLLKVFGSATLCAVMMTGTVLPFSACTPKYDGEAKNKVSMLGLSPETDQLIYAKNGISVRSHQVAENSQFFVNYITLGEYNSTPINWLILAAGQLGSGDNETEIGQAIDAELSKTDLLWTPDPLLGTNQFLVISEKVFSFEQFTVGEFTRVTTPININYRDYLSGGDGGFDGFDSAINSRLCIKEADFFTSPKLTHTPTQFLDATNDLVINDLGLDNYLGNVVIKNNSFNSNHYGFMMTSELIQKYVPSYALKAYDFDDQYQARAYWCANDIHFAISGGFGTGQRVEEQDSDTQAWYRYYEWPSGTKKGHYTGAFVSNTGAVQSIPYNVVAKASQSGGFERVYREVSGEKGEFQNIQDFYLASGIINFSSEGEPTTTAYYRPAMVIDVSKLS